MSGTGVGAPVVRPSLKKFRAEIAQQPMMGIKTAKESVNQMQNEQGFYNALRSAMTLQQFGHAQNHIVHGSSVDPSGMNIVRELAKKPPLDE